ncbi:type II toxin-antitoxin system RelE/ParE family toxin [Capnocytophaga granulosa]|uniref:type II toxin-antitoxin system RelE/ParE family toxin n=1 Tax=Capnocytophaga granulosa TaxID=45242 RepID=UPI0023F50D23|nr:type II toxin-antitoxin system RelE/ParE family toxin [Capnocytophaga granulosa]
MLVKWVENAEDALENTLLYWREHNGSNAYPLKILQALRMLKAELEKDPYLKSRYSEVLGLRMRTILKGRFIIYYEVRETEKIVEIQHFRSSKQQSLEEII